MFRWDAATENRFIMRILFCNEAFIIDGVASYNLYLSSALQQAGHDVAVVGRWGGLRGFQRRHRHSDVTVLQRPVIKADSPLLIKQAVGFNPDILFTDSRRSFPLAQRIRKQTDAKIITVFHDPPQHERTGIRSISSLLSGSDIWIAPEKPIYEQLLPIAEDLPVRFIQRPITGMVTPTPLPPKDPFHVLCLGRLSRWKSPGLKAIVEYANKLKSEIPTLQITVVGGGRRRLNFWLLAQKANARAGKRFVTIAGTQTDPQPWIKNATVVCAGATAAIEAILSGRPALAFSGYWMGLVTPKNLKEGIDTHFGERTGSFHVKEDPKVVVRGLIDLYRQWDHSEMSQLTGQLQQQLSPDFDSRVIAETFHAVFNTLLSRIINQR